MNSFIYPIETIGVVKEDTGKIIRVSNADLEPLGIITDCGEETTDQHLEGKLVEDYVTKYERNVKARNECINHFGATCRVCEFDFEKTYGEIGKGYIHVHHIIPLSEIGMEYTVNPIKDLIPVCPNCHAMLHHKGTSKIDLSVEKLKKLLEERN